jgi:hypothetical protein
MNGLGSERKKESGVTAPHSTWLRWILIAWLGASLLFAHGCHGDEDHELFTRIVALLIGG